MLLLPLLRTWCCIPPIRMPAPARIIATTAPPRAPELGPPPRIRVVVISSGTYAHGSPEVFGADANWTMTEAMQMYGQSKYELQMWALNLAKQVSPVIDVVLSSPGPIHTEMGAEHVPLPILPTYNLMKLLFFPPAEEVAETVIALAHDTPYGSGTFLHIRENRTDTLRPDLLHRGNIERLFQKTARAMKSEGFTVPVDHLADPGQLLLETPGVWETALGEALKSSRAQA